MVCIGRSGRAAVAAGGTAERDEVRRPGAQRDEQQAEQHDGRAERGVEDEPVRGVPAGGLAAGAGRRTASPTRRLACRRPSSAMTNHIGTSTISNATKNSSRSCAVNVASAPASTARIAGDEPADPPRRRAHPDDVPADQQPEQRGEQHQRRARCRPAPRWSADAERGDPGHVDGQARCRCGRTGRRATAARHREHERARGDRGAELGGEPRSSDPAARTSSSSGSRESGSATSARAAATERSEVAGSREHHPRQRRRATAPSERPSRGSR